MIYGVDVASYEGDPNWSQVRAAGISFGFSKVTQGTGYVNPTWAHNRSGMLALGSGFLAGAYHFLEEGDAAGQVAYFLAHAGDVSQMAVGLDVEPATSSPSVATAHAWVNEFHRQRPGHPVLCYLPEWYWQQLGDPNISFADPIWQSRYVSGSGSPAGLAGRVPASWWNGYGGGTVALLQYSDSGTVPGISGAVDVSAFRGTLADLRTLALGGSSPTPTPPEDDDMPYGQLAEGAQAITPISLPRGRYKTIGFIGDNGLQILKPAELRVAIHTTDAKGAGSWSLHAATVDSAKGQAVVVFPDVPDTDGISVRREDGGDVHVAWEVS